MIIGQILFGIILLAAIIVPGRKLIQDLHKALSLNNEFAESAIKERSGQFISFKKNFIQSGLPLIKMTIGGNRYAFLLDSGASHNYLDVAFVEELAKGGISLQFIGSGEVTNSTETSEAEIVELRFSYNNHNYFDTFMITDMSVGFGQIAEDSGIQLVGILGGGFFQREHWKLDFDRMVVWIK